MSRPHVKDAPMTPDECRRDSRDAMEWRELCAVEFGERVAYPGCPRRATVRRWLIADADFRERYAAALDTYKMSVVEAAVEQADRDVEHMQGRRRVAAMRRQVVARAQWLKLIAATAEVAADAPDRRVARPPVLKEPRGISDEGIAILEAAAQRPETPAPADPASPVSPSWSPEGDHPRVFEKPRAFEEAKETRGSSPFGEDDEKKNDNSLPASPASNDIDDDEPDYAPEDARYRARRRDTKSQATTPPTAEEKKSPWKPDTPTYVRFDVGGGFDVSNQRDEGTGWDSYDPFK